LQITGLILALVVPGVAHAQDGWRTSKVSLKHEVYLGNSSIRMVEVDEAASTIREMKAHDDVRSMAWLPVDFHDGTIEVDVASDIAPDAPDYARGFVGVAFRIDAQERHESIYLRPANATVDDQVRRNHTVQYASFPGYDFEQLRKEAPEKYEIFADIALGRWIHMTITVRGNEGRLYLDHAANAALVLWHEVGRNPAWRRRHYSRSRFCGSFSRSARQFPVNMPPLSTSLYPALGRLCQRRCEAKRPAYLMSET
jgi:hypothetical protein